MMGVWQGEGAKGGGEGFHTGIGGREGGMGRGGEGRVSKFPSHLGIICLELLPGHEDVEESEVEQQHLPLPAPGHNMTYILCVCMYACTCMCVCVCVRVRVCACV